ncbi:MAG: esterase family protein [Planctomycetes bacterium]|nr:esterase family protein [Planctomycetota bacterium]
MSDELVQQYLYGSPEEKEAALAGLNADVDDPITRVRSRLLRQWENRPKGLIAEDRFELSHLRERYPEELLSFLVPDGYDPAEATGLLVLLHGGGCGTPRDKAKMWLLESDEPAAYHFGRELKNCPWISVAPSNLLLPTHQRWSNPESDAYILSVIEEAGYRYHIDPDRVFLLGQSMGGFGAYHIVQTLGDRFATVGCHAGAWYYGFWEGLHGVDFYNMQGVNDAAPGKRPRFTEVAFARFASAILSGYHLPHTYREHQGGHSFSDPLARKTIPEFFEYIKTRRRNPFPEKVVTASRKGAFSLYPSPHFFWVSINETHFGTFELDHIEPTERQPSYCTTDFRHRRIRCEGGTVHATNNGDNTFTVETSNVYSMTLWFHPDMADFAKPVRVVINGETKHDDILKPNLAATLESFGQRRDPGMLFSAKLSFDLKVNDWEQQKDFRQKKSKE